MSARIVQQLNDMKAWLRSKQDDAAGVDVTLHTWHDRPGAVVPSRHDVQPQTRLYFIDQSDRRRSACVSRTYPQLGEADMIEGAEAFWIRFDGQRWYLAAQITTPSERT